MAEIVYDEDSGLPDSFDALTWELARKYYRAGTNNFMPRSPEDEDIWIRVKTAPFGEVRRMVKYLASVFEPKDDPFRKMPPMNLMILNDRAARVVKSNTPEEDKVAAAAMEEAM